MIPRVNEPQHLVDLLDIEAGPGLWGKPAPGHERGPGGKEKPAGEVPLGGPGPEPGGATEGNGRGWP